MKPTRGWKSEDPENRNPYHVFRPRRKAVIPLPTSISKTTVPYCWSYFGKVA